MSPHPSEEELALYTGRDLPPGEFRELDRHVTGCPGCALLVREFSANSQTLRSLQKQRRESDVADVHQNVMSRLSRKASLTFWWKVCPAPVAGIVLATLLSPPYRAPMPAKALKPIQPSVQMAHYVPAAPPPNRSRHARRKARTDLRPGLRSVTLVTRPGEAPVMRVVTRDPNVVILLETVERTETDE